MQWPGRRFPELVGLLDLVSFNVNKTAQFQNYNNTRYVGKAFFINILPSQLIFLRKKRQNVIDNQEFNWHCRKLLLKKEGRIAACSNVDWVWGWCLKLPQTSEVV